MFHIGQRVVCVDDSFSDAESVNRPKKGGVYTVRSLTTHGGVRLVEIVNPQAYYTASGFYEHSFKVERFRPVDETPLEVFRQMLVTPPREPVPAGVEDERRKVNGWEAA